MPDIAVAGGGFGGTRISGLIEGVHPGQTTIADSRVPFNRRPAQPNSPRGAGTRGTPEKHFRRDSRMEADDASQIQSAAEGGRRGAFREARGDAEEQAERRYRGRW